MLHQEMVSIPKKELDALVEDSMFLEALRQAGVDNWDGYDEAIILFEQWENNDE